MAIKITTVDVLKKYFSEVVKRANHHAHGVNSVIYTLLGVVVLRKDDGTDIEVRGTDENATGNILWVQINGQKYALRYEHSNDTVEIRKDTYKGTLVLTINNTTTAQDVMIALP